MPPHHFPKRERDSASRWKSLALSRAFGTYLAQIKWAFKESPSTNMHDCLLFSGCRLFWENGEDFKCSRLVRVLVSAQMFRPRFAFVLAMTLQRCHAITKLGCNQNTALQLRVTQRVWRFGCITVDGLRILVFHLVSGCHRCQEHFLTACHH